MSETWKPVLLGAIALVVLIIEAWLGIEVRTLLGFKQRTEPQVQAQQEKIHDLQTQVAVHASTLSSVNTLTSEVTNEISRLVEVDSGGELAGQLVDDAREIADRYRGLMESQARRLEAREDELRASSEGLHREVRQALADLDGLKKTVEGAGEAAHYAAAQANASPRYVMVEGEGDPALFWLPHEGGFRASLDEIVKGSNGVPVARVAVRKTSGAELQQLELEELGDFQRLLETRWSVRPALVYDSLTIFGRRRVVILELIPSRLADDPSAIPARYAEPAAQAASTRDPEAGSRLQ